MPGVAAHGGRSLSARARLRDEARGSACELGRRLPDAPSPNDAPSGSIWSVAFALRILLFSMQPWGAPNPTFDDGSASGASAELPSVQAVIELTTLLARRVGLDCEGLVLAYKLVERAVAAEAGLLQPCTIRLLLQTAIVLARKALAHAGSALVSKPSSPRFVMPKSATQFAPIGDGVSRRRSTASSTPSEASVGGASCHTAAAEPDAEPAVAGAVPSSSSGSGSDDAPASSRKCAAEPWPPRLHRSALARGT